MAVIAHLRASYEDGFVLVEDEADQSPYEEGRNVFHAIARGRPCGDHGPLKLYELVLPDRVLTIDWTQVPEGAIPIRDKHMQAIQVADGPLGAPEIVSIAFGYSFDQDGVLVEIVQEVS